MNPLAHLAADLLTPAGDVPDPSPAAPYPSVEDAAWRGHSHGSERRCDTECWSEPVAAVQGAAS